MTRSWIRGFRFGACMSVLAAVVALGACDRADWQSAGVGALSDEGDGAFDEMPVFDADDRVPAEAPTDDALALGVLHALSGAPVVHYLNFSDGTTKLTKGADDATKNSSQICAASPFPKFTGSEAQKKTFVSQLSRIVADFNVILTTRRPASGPYSMEMIGPQGNGCTPMGAVGIAPMDCGNRNPNTISFNFAGEKSFGGALTAQEAGHGWGLEHVDVSCDVMGVGYTSKACPGGVPSYAYVDMDGPVIGSPICGKKTQNSYKLLGANVGMWGGGPKPDPFTGAAGGGSGGGGSGGGAAGGSGGGAAGGGGAGGAGGAGGSGGAGEKGGAGGDSGGDGGNGGASEEDSGGADASSISGGCGVASAVPLGGTQLLAGFALVVGLHLRRRVAGLRSTGWNRT